MVTPDCDVTFVVRCGDDEERIGHLLNRVARYLRERHLTFELLVADEGSGDNTVAVAVMLRPKWRELSVLHAAPGHGLRDACRRARGRAIVCTDARVEAPLAPLGFALGRLCAFDVVALGGRFLVLRRTHAWRAFDALVGNRDPWAMERRLLRRARQLGLAYTITHPRRHPWQRWLTLMAGRTRRRLATRLHPPPAGAKERLALST